MKWLPSYVTEFGFLQWNKTMRNTDIILRNSKARLARYFVMLFISAALLIVAFFIGGTDNVLRDLGRFPLWVVLGTIGLFGINLAVVSFRLGRVLSHFGMALPFRIVSKASVSGYVAGLFFISLFGQVAGRHLVLKRFGVPSVFIATLTAYERFVLLIISGGLCLIGAIVIMESLTVIDFLAGISLPEIFLTAGAGLILSLWLGRSRFEAHLISRTLSWASIVNVLEVGAITLIGQLLVFASFMIAVMALQPGIDFWQLLAAVAITSFAASLPLTVNGWGVRELAAVYTLGQIGVSSSNALAVSILVGLCSTAVILIAAPISLKKTVDRDVSRPLSNIKAGGYGIAIEKVAAWIITMATAVLIFFQAHVVLPGGVINLNLADPFAILALAATVLHAVGSRQLPGWRVSQFNMILAVISALLVFAFLNGVLEIGVTQWAFAGRLLGWMVLLGYLSVGYLTVSYLGSHGLRRFSETMISTAVVVVVVQITLRWLDYSDWMSNLHITANFEGFAGNRNAFAFQMLVCSILILAYSILYKRADQFDMKRFQATGIGKRLMKLSIINVEIGGPRLLLLSLLHGFILAGLIFSASRAGLITAVILLTIAWGARLADRKMITMSIVLAVLICTLPMGIGDDLHSIKKLAIQSSFSSEESNLERWSSIKNGFDMWIESPLLGSGLGVFVERSTDWFGEPLVIHSTPVWILAEFGLLGAGVFSASLLLIIRFLYKNGMESTAHRIIAMLLFVFILFGLVHEIFYQRIFWLALGAVMAVRPGLVIISDDEIDRSSLAVNKC